MLMSFRNLVLTSAAFCSTAAFAADQRRVEVPFSFVAKNHAYRAGSYTVAVDWQRSVLTLSENGKSSEPLTWTVGPGATDPSHPKVSLIFDVTGPDHVLRAIQYEAFVTPILDAKPKHKGEASTIAGE